VGEIALEFWKSFDFNAIGKKNGAQSRNHCADLRRFKPAPKPIPKSGNFPYFSDKKAALNRLEPF
jgi:hypothetical protein